MKIFKDFDWILGFKKEKSPVIRYKAKNALFGAIFYFNSFLKRVQISGEMANPRVLGYKEATVITKLRFEPGTF